MMIKVPLKKPIILITIGGDISCIVEFAGKNIFKLRNACRKIHTEDGYSFFEELDEENIFTYIDRNQVIGYSVNTPKISKNNIIKNNNIINLKDFKK